MAYKLTQEQKMDMVMKGMSPLDPQQVEEYFKTRGRGKPMKEALERVGYLVGNDVLKQGMGGAHEKESDYDTAYKAVGLDFGGGGGSRPATNFRQQLENDMSNYQSSGVVSTSELLSLRESNVRKPSAPSGTPEQYFKHGHKLGIAYLNAFIINLKNPNSNSRIEILKALKKISDVESKLNGNLLNAFKKGCIKAENEMYNKLKS